MKRITISISDHLSDRLEQEGRRRGIAAAAVIREALASFLGESAEPARLSFVGIGHSGVRDTARNVDAILKQEWGRAGDR